MKNNKLLLYILCAVILSNTITGCGNAAKNGENSVSVSSGSLATSGDNSDATNISSVVLDTANMFSSSDKEIGYDESESTLITLQDNESLSGSDSAIVSGNIITITDEGTYILSGTLTNGQIIIEAEKTDKLKIVLKSAAIQSETSAPIYVKQADKVFITLAEGTENTLANLGDFAAIDDNNIDAVIYSKEDLTLNGQGSLSVKTEYGHGIVSKDDLVITSGTYEIISAGHGLVGKDSVRIANGDFVITSQKDGIHSENTEDTSLGYVYIAGGTFQITAQTDGIDGVSAVHIDDGEFLITTGGGSENASLDELGVESKEWGKWGQQNQNTTDTASAKAVKADADIIINNGTFEVSSSDDSIHANGNVFINDGIITLSSGDDGIHANTKTVINGGTLTITKSYEGVEGQSIDIAGGSISVTSSDDGVNAAGGNDSSGTGGRPGQGEFTADADCYITISGGVLNVDASGDGVDSNGALYVTGGETYIAGPENSGNGALDYNGTAEISGGIFAAAGASGMAQNFGDSSTQACILVNCSDSQSGTIILKDSTGKELVSFASEKQYNSVLISTPEIKEGEMYTIDMGSETQTIEMTSLIYGTGGEGMGMERPNKNMNGQPPKGERPESKQEDEPVEVK